MYRIYVKKSNGALELTASASTYTEASTKYSELIKYTRIQDVILTEDINYNVVYNSITQQYTPQFSTTTTDTAGT